MTDRWVAWHRAYDEPGSFLHRRLALVQHEIRSVLDERSGRTTRIVSMCAGQGRDLLDVLAGRADLERVRARLVELDRVNAEAARSTAAAHNLYGMEIVQRDAGETDAYAGAVPADLVLVCGVFGNITDDDILRTIRLLPQLCAPDARVIWTRHRRAPDLTPSIRCWFEDAGFEPTAFHAPDYSFFTVGVHRFAGTPAPLERGVRLFTFVGYDALAR
jgi:putative methyltransferase